MRSLSMRSACSGSTRVEIWQVHEGCGAGTLTCSPTVIGHGACALGWEGDDVALQSG
jgi:hypothetical protein